MVKVTTELQGIFGEPIMHGGYDITPRIHYNERGKAFSLVRFGVRDWSGQGDLAVSVYLIDGERYLENQYEPGQGNKPANEVEKSRLEEIDENDADSIPILGILGSTREQVEKILDDRGLTAYHVTVI